MNESKVRNAFDVDHSTIQKIRIRSGNIEFSGGVGTSAAVARIMNMGNTRANIPLLTKNGKKAVMSAIGIPAFQSDQ